MPSSSRLLVYRHRIKSIRNFTHTHPVVISHSTQNITLTKVPYFSKIYRRTSFHDPKLSDASIASISQVRTSAVLLLLIIGN
jgi:hypothetical protein